MKNTLLSTVQVSLLGSLLFATAPAMAQATDNTATDTAPAATSTAAAPATAAPATAHDKDVDKRIKSLHDKLKITKDQEAMWGNVASVMYDNAMAARAEYQEREDKQASMTAIEDIRANQAHMMEHANGLQKLADAFDPLYQAMPPAQQKNADKVFGHGGMHHDAAKKDADKE